jgi:putative DNA methylase
VAFVAISRHNFHWAILHYEKSSAYSPRVSMATSVSRKKLIEVSIPLEAINAASAREKSIRHGHPSTLHLWWARRPLAACRAVLFAQLVDDPSSWPDRFPTEAEQDAERKRLHKVIERLVPWEASNNEAILNEARWEIARSVAWGRDETPPPKDDGKAIFAYLQEKASPLYDPFCGGGSIPLEAQRLGLRVYGSDLNPVAVLISKALVEIPPKFAGGPPINPQAQAELKRGGRWQGKGAQGLAEDVRYYGQWMRDEAKKRIGHLYPKATLPDGSKAIVIAWLWARTVRSPDPAAKGAMVPLVSTFILSAKDRNKAWVELVIDRKAKEGYRFDVKTGNLSKADEERLTKGTKGEGRGSNFSCALTGATISGGYIKTEGTAGRLGARLMAIVCQGRKGRAGNFGEDSEKGQGRIYISPTEDHEAVASSIDVDERVIGARDGALNQQVPERLTGGTCYSYGLTTFGKLFTPRQLVALTTFSDLVAEARQKALDDAGAAGNSIDDRSLHTGGFGATAYADAIATYLGLGVSKLSDYNSSLVVWSPTRDQAKSTFARQALPMVWDFAEVDTFGEAAGDLTTSISGLSKALGALPSTSSAICDQHDARKLGIEGATFSTDPPYYDNIGYADLSDFFYVWLKRSLSEVWPDLFRRLATPKSEELVATPYRHGGRDDAESFFMKGMAEALTAMRKAATDDEPLVIYYAYKQAESAEGGVTSAGWASFLQAVVDADLTVDGTWPIRTERGARSIGIGTNALASSIVLVCRKRSADATVITRADFIRALKREMPEAIPWTSDPAFWQKHREIGCDRCSHRHADALPCVATALPQHVAVRGAR